MSKESTKRKWCWPLMVIVRSNIPRSPHPGGFGAIRKHDIHTGIDLYCEPGTLVRAAETGTIVAIEDYTGPKADSPWWHDTRAILVEGSSGVICYGELEELPLIVLGKRVERGFALGHVKTVLRKDKGRPMSMLHIELYKHDVRKSVWWKHGEPQPEDLLDVTPFLENAS